MPSTKDIKKPYVIIRVTEFGAIHYFKSNEKGNEQTDEKDARNIIKDEKMKMQKVIDNGFESDSIFHK